MDDATRKLLLEAVDDASKADVALTQTRLELRARLRKARAEGVSISELARTLNLSRTRVRQLLEE